MVFLLFRTVSVLFSSALINEAAQKPLHYIRNVPSQYWTLDVRKKNYIFQRFSSLKTFSKVKTTSRYDRNWSTDIGFFGTAIFPHHEGLDFSGNFHILPSFSSFRPSLMIFLLSFPKMVGTITTFEILLLDEVDVTPNSLCSIIDRWIYFGCKFIKVWVSFQLKDKKPGKNWKIGEKTKKK